MKNLSKTCLCAAILLVMRLGAMNKEFDVLASLGTFKLQQKVFNIINQKGAVWNEEQKKLNLNGWSEDEKLEELKKISKDGALDPDSTYMGVPAIHSAIGHGYLKIVTFLIENGADINIACTGTNYTPLHQAILRGNIDIAKLLIEKGADLKKEAFAKLTALGIAAQNGYMEIIKILIDKNIDIQTKDALGNTVLHSAAFFGNIDVLKLLIQKGIKYDVKNKKGLTALRTAELGYDHIELMINARKGLELLGTKFYENDETTVSKNICESRAYLILVTDFYRVLKGKKKSIFEGKSTTDTFESFAKKYFSDNDAEQHITDVEKLLPLDTKKDFTNEFTKWRKQNNKSEAPVINANLNNLTTNSGVINTCCGRNALLAVTSEKISLNDKK